MNKSLFRIVFNARRGQMMVVMETASAQGKPATGHKTLVSIAQPAIKNIVAAIALLSAPAWAQAQVVANTAAPANQQPTVTTTASGITQVNIQTPTNGVSRNRYIQFDVTNSGLILNNSAVNSNTRLAGWVQGNTNLPGGSASVILNEVNSSNPSQLRGFIEVAGQRAQVVIANPSGIVVNGGGFINASGATLTTGTPQFSGNTLQGYNVTGGTITVTGAGLDTSTTNITTLQAQRIMLQGGVWAQDLRLLGDNSAGSANAVAIDVAAIGGMYANKITILATGQGAGVNNAGIVQANSGSFTLSADGTLTNTGTINSTETTRINATTVNNSTGGAIFGGSVAIAANTLNNAAATSAYTAPVIAARDASGRVDIGVQTLNNQEGALIYSAGSLHIGGGLDANGQATGRATTVTNNSATLEASGNVGITTQTLNNTYTSLRYRVVEDRTENGSESCGADCTHSWTDTFYRAEPIAGAHGAAVIRAGGDINLDASSRATNSSSQILAAGNVNNVGSATLDNQGIDLTTEVRTRRDHHVAQSYMDNFVNCLVDFFGHRFGCQSERRTNHSYSTSYTANNQTVSPAITLNRTTSTSTTPVPNSALFSASNNPNYLVETNPAFTNRQIWLSSDYMLQALSVDADTVQKRMGDGFYEQRLINEQVAKLTGYRRLANFSSDEQQYQALMSAGITFAQAHQLRVGIELSAEQVAQLTSDMVWLVQREVTLPNGTKEKVLVPQVYAVARSGDLENSGALLSGNVVNINTTGDVANSNGATILGRQLVSLNAANVRNLGARVQGKDVQINATQDIENTGGAVIAQNSLQAQAGRDIKVQTTTLASTSAPSSNPAPQKSGAGVLGFAAKGDNASGLQTSSTSINRVAGLYVTGDAGVLLASAGRDVQLTAALLQSNGSTNIVAGRDIALDTVTTSRSLNATMDAGNYNRTSQSAEVGSTLQSKGNATLAAAQNINARAADVQAAGNLTATAGNNVVIESGVASSSEASSRVTANGGFLSSSTRTERSSTSSTQAVASNLGGQNITVTSGKDIGVKGSSVVADKDVTLAAGNNITVEAATNSQTSTRYSALSEAGLMNSGDFGYSIGTRDQSTDSKFTATTAAASTVGSVGGNVTIAAGNTYTQRGSDVVASGQTANQATDFNALLNAAPSAAGAGPDSTGNVTITAKKVDIVEARETTASSTEQKFNQTGITVAVQSSVVQGAQTVQAMDQAMMKTKSDRMKALGAASAAMAAKQAMSGPTVSASASIGSSESTSTTTSNTDTARGSSITAANTTIIKATGAGESSNVRVQGSTIQSDKQTKLIADNQVQLLAAANTARQTSSQRSSSASAGVTAGSNGLGVTASGSMGRGGGNGSDLYYTNTRIEGNNLVLIQSGGDTTVQGAVVKGNTVKADVGGNLKVESLSDTSRYNESSQNVSGSVTIGAGAGGSVSLGGSNINSDYQNVAEQSGIRAGDGGFQLNVAGSTDLKGGAITSTDKAVTGNKNSFQTAKLTTSDIQNSASYNAESYQVTVGSSGGAAGMGNDSGKANSTTTAAISGIAGNKAARTGDKETGIQKIFDAAKVKDEIGAQVAITTEFGKQAPRAVAKFADDQRADLLKQLKDEADPTKRAQLLAESKKWEEGGSYRVLMHTALGGLGGGVNGAIGAGMVASAAPLMNEMQDKLAATLVNAGLSEETAAAISKTVAQTTALATGAALGGAQGGAMALNVDANNRQLHPTEAKLIKDNAARYAKQRGISVERAEAELTQQAERNNDSAHATRLGADDAQAQSFLKELGAGTNMVDGLTGQKYQLFSADEATRDNHAQFGQYAKTSPQVQQLLDVAYAKVYQPKEGQTIAGVNGSNAGALTGSDLALNDAARDYGNMRKQPAIVQWAVLGELRQERQINLQSQLALTQELQQLNSKGDSSPAAAARRGQILDRLTQLDAENTTLRQASVEQLRAMGDARLLNPADQREWIEGAGSAIGSSGLALKGLSAASISGRIGMLREAVKDTQAATAAAKAEAQAIAKARVENNVNAENAQDPFNIQSPENTVAAQNLKSKAAADQAAGTYNPHYDPKHGPGTTLRQQYDRAISGTNPQTGGTGKPADASKFFNATDMEAAIKQAEAQYAVNPGAYATGNVSVQFNRPIGEGYTGATRQNRDAGIPAGEYRWSNTATVGIDPNSGRAYTAYPNVIQGTAMPDPLKTGVQR